ncbi:MAG: sigma-54-dependent Fis family transcriptional regulator [Planctomycetales bacterium]|nr:sigma-54-dependent Fis family transcriptional regulator [Planctomycetales bacterium]
MNDFANTDLLFVDDDDEIRKRASQYFRDIGCEVSSAPNGEAAIELLSQRVFQVAILDVAMPGMNGIELLEKIRGISPETEVVMLTGQGTIETAVQAMKLGAHDFLTKPVRFKHLAAVVQRAIEAGHLRKENRQLRAVIERSRNGNTSGMVGQSPAMQEVFRLVERVGPTDKPILIQGESGTGKELVAKALHQASQLSAKPLVVINCAALPESLLESELFGHEKGAFTGAASAKEGLFEVADGGTLFIDEIGELSPALQPKLLRVLEDGWMRRVGSVRDRRVNVRVLAATNRDLGAEVEAKRFREDLYYRINVLTIQIPPLRERGDDTLLLADKFAGPGWDWEPAAREAIQKYSWPGNVRQLMNAIERAKILADDEVIRRRNLPPEITAKESSNAAPADFHQLDLAALTRARVVEAMRQERGNKLRSAQLLGVSRRSLYRLLEKYQVTDDEVMGS